ncbi:MAG TPA: hypothetical protein VFH80_24880, partial [Solirubrobacteraceae bacterium]|nr:hypothetical protein [Solirubrobacteraceae bacterium]
MSGVSAAIETTDAGTERGQITVALAAMVWSTAGVLQRQLSVGVAAQVAGRALLGEPVSRRTSVAMIVALLGVGVMVGSPGGGSAL